MKKNKMMRIASALLVAVILTTCAISGTFAKYVTSTPGSDSARVAKFRQCPYNRDVLDGFAVSISAKQVIVFEETLRLFQGLRPRVRARPAVQAAGGVV